MASHIRECASVDWRDRGYFRYAIIQPHFHALIEIGASLDLELKRDSLCVVLSHSHPACRSILHGCIGSLAPRLPPQQRLQ